MKDKLVLRGYKTSKRKLNKYKNNNIDTIYLKDHLYYGGKYYENNIDVKNLEIVYKSPKMYLYSPNFTFFDIKCENIYFKNEENLGGITLSLNHIIKNNINHIDFHWQNNKEKPSNINKLNIITYNKAPIKIDLIPEELEEINIKLSTDHKLTLNIRIKNTNSEKIYEIDFDGELKERIIHYTISERDLENGVLDLTKFKDFNVVTLTNINIDTLIINKHDIENIRNIDLYDDVFINNIKVIDNNDMKLNPYTIIPFNDDLDCYDNYIISDNERILIYEDEENNLKVFNKDEILKDNKISDVIFFYDEGDIIIVYKYKKLGKYKIIIDDKEYLIDRLFTLFIKGNINTYYFSSKAIYDCLENYDWVKILDKKLESSTFIKMYEDYLIFKENLNKLHKLGFSHKYFMYLHQKGLDSLIIEMCKNFKLIEYSKNEINDLNEIGRKYVKKLK